MRWREPAGRVMPTSRWDLPGAAPSPASLCSLLPPQAPGPVLRGPVPSCLLLLEFLHSSTLCFWAPGELVGGQTGWAREPNLANRQWVGDQAGVKARRGPPAPICAWGRLPEPVNSIGALAACSVFYCLPCSSSSSIGRFFFKS